MTTAATISVNLALKSDQFQTGMKKAEAATKSFEGRFNAAMASIRRNAVVLSQIGDGLTDLGKKMTTFVTIPIIGFFALLVKKAMEADTALAKTAQESVGKLNEQLMILGEKLLPMVIDALDWLTDALEAFNNAPQWVQDTVFALVSLAALAGPLSTFVGTLFKIAVFFSGAGGGGAIVTFITSTLIPTIVSIGTAIWGALLPLLPVLALIAAVIVLIYLLWKHWDELGVILSQLWAIIKFGFEKMWEGLKAAMSDGLNWLEQETSKSLDVWKNNFKQAEEIKQKLFKLSVDTMFKWWTDFSTKVTAKITEVRNFFVNAWNYVAGVFFNIFTAISNFFNAVIVGIINGINALIEAINALGFALETLEIPPELTPGSPTPFEIGLKGISKAMDTLSKKSIPEMSMAFAGPSGMSEVRGGRTVNYTDNRRFSAGVTPEAVKLALQNQFEGLEKALGDL